MGAASLTPHSWHHWATCDNNSIHKTSISSPSYALGGNIIFLFDLQDSSWTPNIKFFYVKGRMETIRETDLHHDRLRAVGLSAAFRHLCQSLDKVPLRDAAAPPVTYDMYPKL